MQKKLKLAVMALCCSTCAFAQSNKDQGDKKAEQSEQAFTFTESQLGEDDDMSQNVTIIRSNSNIYASEVGYLFSPVRFRYRAFNQKYNEIYINGAPMNDPESGQFRFSLVGGLNNQTRDVEYSLPFEDNNFSMTAMGGSNNYNFRPSHFAAGHKASLMGTNRNYTFRGMYTYNTGLMENGWAFTGNLTYRWANQGYVEGTFYNSLSYFLGAEKVINDKHSLSFVTWGNPTERASQGASTDEMYWIANDRFYNPYWGYQNGKKRNSRVINDFAPSAMFTWDWKINDNLKLTTTLSGKYSMYKSTKLNYNNSDNPQPDYYKVMPSRFYDPWDKDDDSYRTEQALADWKSAYDFLSSSKANRQINFDKLIASNYGANAAGQDAMYYIIARHNNQMAINLSSSLRAQLSNKSVLNIGMNMSTNKGFHYLTIDDLLGAEYMHNINSYASSNYAPGSDKLQYDLNHPNASLKVGDKYQYDYNILVDKAQAWTTYSGDVEAMHGFISARIGGVQMQRDGKMRNGLAANNSYGKSGVAHFLDGGMKAGANLDLGRGHTLALGMGYEWRAPTANTSFAAPEINNDFVTNLKNEQVRSFEVGYQFSNNWLKANLSAYYSYVEDATEWQCFYFDDANSFSYVSLTGVEKEYFGVEYGLNFKLSSAFNIKAIGTLSQAQYANDAKVRYMYSTSAEYGDPETCYTNGLHESGTPLLAQSLIASFHKGGWFIDVNGNYYDKIYLSPSLYHRYESVVDHFNGEPVRPDQSEGKGGFMLDASIGKSIYLKHGSLSINLTVNNILNNTDICTGGYEQARSDTSVESGNSRGYKFTKNPKKFYAFGTNGMLNLTYKF